MKVKMLCRDPNEYVRETKKDIFKSNFIFLVSIQIHDPSFVTKFLVIQLSSKKI
jgi:hypothetical protein